MVMEPNRRNQPCPCDSGKRYKQCCGRLHASADGRAHPPRANDAANFGTLMSQALAAQTDQRLLEAESLYRAALAINPRSFDALHMLGVVCLQLRRPEEASELLIAALPLQATDYPPLFQNLGLCLAAVAKARGTYSYSDEVKRQGTAHRQFFRRNKLPDLAPDPPRVSIVAPCYNHAQYVAEALASIESQTYRNIELIIIDDGSTDDSATVINRVLADCGIEHRFLQRENRGADSTLNQCIELATGHYIGVLNTDDSYVPERTEYMVRMLQATGARWGFSNVAYMDGEGRSIAYGEQARVDALMKGHDDLYRCHAVSEGFPMHNHAVSSGNLFFERSLWQEIGGFEALRYHHEWAFCLAAIPIAEPGYLDEPAYRCRLKGINPALDSHGAARQEVDFILSRWHQRVASTLVMENQSLAAARTNRRNADFAVMASGAGHSLDRASLLAYAAELGLVP
jgi:hypothetical protein